MARTVWKFELGLEDKGDVDMPVGAHIIDVRMQNGVPCIWAIVDSEGDRETRRFLIAGTGWPLPGAGRHVGTVHTDRGLVWHIFDVLSEEVHPL